jgi:tetratricopeptide (TPR) repeat protein
VAAPPSNLWEEVLQPGRVRCTALVRRAERMLPPRGAKSEEARQLLLDGRASCATSVELLALLGRLQLERGDYVEARALLEEARRLSPEDAELDAQLAVHLGFVRSVQGDLLGSLVEYRRAEAVGPLEGDAWLLAYDVGDSLMALGRVGEAIEAYRRAIRLAPSQAIPRFALAVALDRDGQTERSRVEALAGLARDPRLRTLTQGQYVFVPPAEVHYYRFVAHRARNSPVEAVQALRAFVAELPSSPYAERAREQLRALDPSPSSPPPSSPPSPRPSPPSSQPPSSQPPSSQPPSSQPPSSQPPSSQPPSSQPPSPAPAPL